ncbi:hypothetical protein CS063_03615 [Sporanaerobium hydrogeniformans]|uniref:Uncharacterized protein n=1 Tax=Sporanaerobium hydrogeniformans TaxID=3072179 RepID=A0AC61DG71_9FIRM|nr:TraX family protein [Sporanaerobium hydrogeniformans]PHV71661.1 hypothetical protein CS063_03615 [Sporanaerobium hydrogeniformans]
MLKLIALCLMLVDHFGMVFFPEVIGFRMIGRLSMPLFAYGLARGFQKTRSLKKYKERILLFAFISQIPYGLMNVAVYQTQESFWKFNIGFTFWAALGVLSSYKGLKTFWHTKRKIQENFLKSSGYLISIMLLVGFVELFQCDYGAYGILLVVAFYEGYVCQKNILLTLVLIFGATLMLFATGGSFLVAMQLGGGVLGFLLVLFVEDTYFKSANKWLYSVYPMHMLLFAFIKQLQR